MKEGNRGLLPWCVWAGALSIAICGTALSQTTSAPTEPITVVRPSLPLATRQFRASLMESVPALRGFTAPILADAGQAWMPSSPAQLSGELKIAADIVARRLAKDGVLGTLAQVIEVLGYRRIVAEREGIVELIRSLGFPVDLLQCFPQNDTEFGEPFSLIIDVTRTFEGDRTSAEVGEEVRNWKFKWRKTNAEFRIATDTGESEIDTLRLQICGDKYYLGAGDGGTIDLTRQLVEKLPDVSFLASIEEKHVEGFLAISKGWDWKRPRRMALFVELLPVAQWAQDNAKVGWVGSAQDGSLKPALLVPRYASRREEVSAFVPGDSFLFDALAAQGWVVLHSPLHFQGGDLIAVREPTTGRRVLLVGEADIYRNVALGMTAEQVMEAFRDEFEVDHVEVLPAISYHIDYEVSPRSTPQGVIAFVNDEMAASRKVLSAGIDALARQNLVDPQTLARCQQSLHTDKLDPTMQACEEVLEAKAVGYGQFPLSFANYFSVGVADSGVGNLQRFLLALDVAAFGSADSSWRPPEPHGEAYARSLRRRAADRMKMREQLEHLGWKVVPVPSTSDGDRSLNYLNGVHAKGLYLMPAYGGLYTGLDEEAAGIFRRHLGSEVRIAPILCGESQRRHGAVRCSVCVLPRTE